MLPPMFDGKTVYVALPVAVVGLIDTLASSIWSLPIVVAYLVETLPRYSEGILFELIKFYKFKFNSNVRTGLINDVTDSRFKFRPGDFFKTARPLQNLKFDSNLPELCF